MLTENKFSKYLLYAIGEVILVVIGILIALQINNWNEERKENTELSQYKQRLIKQFQKDSTDLLSSNEGYKYITPIFKTLDSTFRENINGNVNKDSIIQIPVFITLQSEFISETHALNELNNTGKMSLFKNDSLKDKLTEYQILIEQQHNIIGRTKNKFDDFDKLLIRKGKFGGRHYLVRAQDINQDAFMNEYWYINASWQGQRLLYDKITKTNHEILKLLRQ
tara:strand:+ start:30079 stop:30747 length:669 start_codon:yes stop_codon:yes gene_type:complete